MTTETPSPDAEWWTTSDVATYLRVDISTISGYRRRNQMPKPDTRLGSRTWLWKPARIIEWDKNRPRKHTRGEEDTSAPD
ncbi:helix-turn-helix transcriptional regulator [Pseudonocardia sp. H11422]|uniref:helix-turn-helix transcriptional regulator n=1 Tax=Pseudonocardia sp. H11422 TaxID=2835866 RepID=UPI001BDDBE8E|nr:helix-turn-helix domain-containing protein [Pseudonocardia sp. H11422]